MKRCRLLALPLCAMLLAGCFGNEEPDKSSGSSGEKASVQMQPHGADDEQGEE